MISTHARSAAGDFHSKADRSLWIVPVAPDDAAALAAMLAELSPATVRRRYLMPRALSEEDAAREAARLTRPDDARIVLVAQTQAEEDQIIAVAELALDPAELGLAEGAVVVADAYQGEGIGRAVVERLAQAAAAASIRRVRATTSVSNTPVRRLIASFGRPYTAHFSGSEVQYEVVL